MHVSFGRATCAGHKQKYVRNELSIPSTQLGTQMQSLAWLGQGLCLAQHAIHVARPSYNTHDRCSKAPRQGLTWWFCGASSRSYGPPAGSGI